MDEGFWKEFIINFVIGGFLIATASAVASKQKFVLAGLLLLFPTKALLTLIITGRSGGNIACLGLVEGMFVALIPWIVFLASVYLCLKANVGYLQALVIALALWLFVSISVELLLEHP